MNEAARQALIDHVAAKGAAALRDPAQLRTLATAAAGGNSPEEYVLTVAVDIGVVADLLAQRDGAVGPNANDLAGRLVEQRGIQPQFAGWAVAAWQAAIRPEAANLSGEAPSAPLDLPPTDPLRGDVRLRDLPSLTRESVSPTPAEVALRKPSGLRRLVAAVPAPIEPHLRLAVSDFVGMSALVDPGERIVAFVDDLIATKAYGGNRPSLPTGNGMTVLGITTARLFRRSFGVVSGPLGDEYKRPWHTASTSQVSAWTITKRDADVRFYRGKQWWDGGFNFGYTLRYPNGKDERFQFFAPNYCERWLSTIAEAFGRIVLPSATE